MPTPKMTMGVGAAVSIRVRYLHPSLVIRNFYPNQQHGQRLENCRVIRQEVKKINRKDKLAIIVKHDDFKNGEEHVELHAIPRWFKVTAEGNPDLFFTDVVNDGAEGAAVPAGEQQQDATPQQILLSAVSRRVDVNDLRSIPGIQVDDDNLPAPENVPVAGETVTDDIYSPWGHDGICYRRTAGGEKTAARVKGIQNDTSRKRRLVPLMHGPASWMELSSISIV